MIKRFAFPAPERENLYYLKILEHLSELFLFSNSPWPSSPDSDTCNDPKADALVKNHSYSSIEVHPEPD